MKTSLIYILIISLVFTACDSTWLEPKPLSINTPENIYVDKNGMESVLLSLRAKLRTDYYSIYGDPGMLVTEMNSSEMGVAGEQRQDNVINHDLYSIPTRVGAYLEYRYWNVEWEPIRDANVVISRINVPLWKSEEDKNEILGEAYFHRALWYYRLVHQYGDVPFLNREYTSPKIDFFSHSRKTILTKIEQDLEFSVNWLPEKVDPGKVNRAAAYHLLTKVYLANSEFDKAINAASAIIDGGKFELMTNRFGSVANDGRFNVIWDLHQPENKSISSNKEGILIVQDKFGFPGAQTSQGTRSMRFYTPWWSHALYLKDSDGTRACIDTNWDPQIIRFGRGVGIFRPSSYYNFNIWINAGEDLRHDSDTNWLPTSKILINNPKSKYFGQPVNFANSNQKDSIRAWYPWPHYKVYVKDQNAPQKPVGGNSDWYVFRLAETYLLRAEAYFWKEMLSEAANDINKVRVRAHAPSITSDQVNIGFILDERARELYLEEPRKTELTRIALIMAENSKEGYSLNNFTEKNFWYDRIIEKNDFYNKGIIWETFEYKISPYHVFWPVPQSAIDANAGGRINQNKGYDGFDKNVPPKTSISDED